MGFYALMLVLVGLLNVTGPASAARHLMLLVPWIAGATMILCAIGALGQTDMRRILSYQVIAQVGYMATGLLLGRSRASQERCSTWSTRSSCKPIFSLGPA